MWLYKLTRSLRMLSLVNLNEKWGLNENCVELFMESSVRLYWEFGSNPRFK